MKHICNVIPVTPCFILFFFEEENLKMKIKLNTREYCIFFKTIDKLKKATGEEKTQLDNLKKRINDMISIIENYNIDILMI